MWRQNKSWRVTRRRTLMSLDSSGLPISENPDHHTHEPFIQQTHLKIPLLSWVFQLSNCKPGCKGWILSLFCEIDTTNGLLTPSSVRKVLFSASYPRIDPCFTAGKWTVGYIEIVTQLVDTGKRPSPHLQCIFRQRTIRQRIFRQRSREKPPTTNLKCVNEFLWFPATNYTLFDNEVRKDYAVRFFTLLLDYSSIENFWFLVGIPHVTLVLRHVKCWDQHTQKFYSKKISGLNLTSEHFFEIFLSSVTNVSFNM
jgi:hypothetical protein